MSNSILADLPVLSSRGDRRVACERAAKIIISPELPAIRCTVVNISAGGAGISLGVGITFDVPGQFLLHIDGERERRPCRTAWMQSHALGVEFLQPSRLQ